MIRRGMQPHKTKIATIRYTNDCDFTSYSKRELRIKPQYYADKI